MNTKVSVIIPCFNNESTILETLESVYGQSYSDIEVIVINDGSTDDSEKVIATFLEEKTDLVYLKQSNKGPSAARNFGSRIANGQYLIFLDGDDLLHKDYISICVNAFEKNDQLDLVYSDSELFENESGNYNLARFDEITILTQNCFPIVAMIRSESFRDIGQFDENLRIAEDWEMWIRYTHKYSNVKKIDMSLFFYRKRYIKNSITDLNKLNNIMDDAHLYIYNKHYNTYKSVGWNIINLINTRQTYSKYKDKYYNVWYRKLFYLFNKKK